MEKGFLKDYINVFTKTERSVWETAGRKPNTLLPTQYLHLFQT